MVDAIQTSDPEDDAHELDLAVRKTNLDILEADILDTRILNLVQQHMIDIQMTRMFLNSK